MLRKIKRIQPYDINWDSVFPYTFSNNTKTVDFNCWSSGMQLGFNSTDGKFYAVVIDKNGIGFFIDNTYQWQKQHSVSQTSLYNTATQALFGSNGKDTVQLRVKDSAGNDHAICSNSGTGITVYDYANSKNLFDYRQCQKITTTSTGHITFYRIGKFVTVQVYNIQAKLTGSWDSYKIATIPSGFTPKDQIRQKVLISNYDAQYSTGIWATGSSLYIANFGGSGFIGTECFSCTATWLAS